MAKSTTSRKTSFRSGGSAELGLALLQEATAGPTPGAGMTPVAAQADLT